MACPWCGYESYTTDDGDWLRCLNCQRWRLLNTHPHMDLGGVINAEIALSYLASRK